jgi:hypothetical protein
LDQYRILCFCNFVLFFILPVELRHGNRVSQVFITTRSACAIYTECYTPRWIASDSQKLNKIDHWRCFFVRGVGDWVVRVMEESFPESNTPGETGDSFYHSHASSHICSVSWPGWRVVFFILLILFCFMKSVLSSVTLVKTFLYY